MKIQSNDLINLPVFTQSGRNLGRIDSFEIDIDTHAINCYYIKTGLIKGLWHEKLIIHQSQVISISKEKMIVEDNIGEESVAELKKIGLAAPMTK